MLYGHQLSTEPLQQYYKPPHKATSQDQPMSCMSLLHLSLSEWVWHSLPPKQAIHMCVTHCGLNPEAVQVQLIHSWNLILPVSGL